MRYLDTAMHMPAQILRAQRAVDVSAGGAIESLRVRALPLGTARIVSSSSPGR